MPPRRPAALAFPPFRNLFAVPVAWEAFPAMLEIARCFSGSIAAKPLLDMPTAFLLLKVDSMPVAAQWQERGKTGLN